MGTGLDVYRGEHIVGWSAVQRQPHTTIPYRMSAWMTRGGLLLLIMCLPGLIWVPLGHSQVCSIETTPCVGRYGSGCYNSAYATCSDGLICPLGAQPCIGRYGAGCYNPAYASCSAGLVCTQPLRPCLRPHGATCYNPATATCAAGRRKHR
jgi:hypothetical protein